jgi:non-specific serine/threonine protein kinase
MTTHILGRYTLHESLGRGGMGDVFRATDTQTGQTVAIKQLRSDLLAADAGALNRFTREGEVLRALAHPNIVQFLATVEENGQHYLILEYIDGGDLNGLMSHGTLPLERTLKIALELCDALARAHHLGVIHRDIKPSNILIAPDGTPRLSDFGIAMVENEARMTQTGMMLGTVEAIPPELFSGGSPDTGADLWALGVLLYEMLTHVHPFRSASITETVMKIITEHPTPIEQYRPDLPIALVDLIDRMLQKDRAARLSSARVAGVIIESVLAGAITSPALPILSPDAASESTETLTLVVSRRGNLPVHTTPFIGREAELEALSQLLADSTVRLTTILAPGGMGKTRLAQAVVDGRRSAHADGVYWVELAPVSNPDDVVGAIADAVGFKFYAGGNPKQQVAEYLSKRDVLLVLDNFEHVTPAASWFESLLQAAPKLRVLVTSRERLSIQGEHAFPLGGLDIPTPDTPDFETAPAVRLFMQSARRTAPGLTFTTDDWGAIAQICRMVDGLPLGIVIAAGWSEALRPAEIVTEIQRDRDFLETDLRDLPERHRSLRAVFNYSWRLLRDEDQRLLARLAAFRGGFSREAAETITGAKLRALLSLVNRSLVRRNPDTGMFYLHEMTRQFAEERLETSGEADGVRTAHSTYYLEILTACEADLRSSRYQTAVAQLDAALENLRTAWRWAVAQGDSIHLGQASAAINVYFDLRGNYNEFRQLFDPAIERVRELPASPERDGALISLLCWHALNDAYYGDGGQCRAALADMMPLLANAYTAEREALIKTCEGLLELYFGTSVAARPSFERAVTLSQTAGNTHGTAQALTYLAQTYWYRVGGSEMDVDKARELHAAAYDLHVQHDDPVGRANAKMSLGTVEIYAGKLDAAESQLLESKALFEAQGNLMGVAGALVNFAVAALREQRFAAVTNAAQEALKICLDLGSAYRSLWPQWVLALTAQRAGNHTEATRLCRVALPDAISVESHDWQATLNYIAGFSTLAQGDGLAARHHYQIASEAALRAQRDDIRLFSLVGRGWALISISELDSAAQSFQTCLDEAQSDKHGHIEQAAQLGLGIIALKRGQTGAAEKIEAIRAYLADESSQPTNVEWVDFERGFYRALSDAAMAIGGENPPVYAEVVNTIIGT